MTFSFGTLCSGIEAASEAFLPLGAECRYVSEIEPYPCGVLGVRHGASRPLRMPSPEAVEFPAGYDPDDAALYRRLTDRPRRLDSGDREFVAAWVERAARRAAIKTIKRYVQAGDRIPNYGDLTQIDPDELPEVDLLVAGFPCQDFSIAGLRASLAGARGNLTLFGVKLIHELRQRRRIRAVLLEQVPDILNTKDNAFGALLGGLVGHDAAIRSPLRGGRWTNVGVARGPLGAAAWRVEDAQYSGLAQRRERLFLVGSFGDGPDPVEVLLERQGLSRHPPARRKAGEGLARPLAAGSASSGGYRNDADTAENLIPTGEVAPALRVKHNASHRPDSDAYVATRAAFGGNNTSGPVDLATARTASHTASGRQDFETETFIVEAPELATTIRARDGAKGIDSDATDTLIAFDARQSDVLVYGEITGPVDTGQPGPAIAFSCKDHGADAGEISPTLRSMGHANSHPNAGGQVAVAFSIMPMNSGKDYKAREVDVAQPVMAAGPVGGNQGGDYVVQPGAVAFSLRGRAHGAQAEVEDGDVSPSLRAADGGSTRPFVACATGDVTHTLTAEGFDASEDGTGRPPPLAADGMAVRRITVVEAERLQGFRDNYTLIPWPTANRKGQDLAETVAYLIGHGFSREDAEILAQTPDGPRYKAIGNSKPVTTVRKIGAAFGTALQRYLERSAS